MFKKNPKNRKNQKSKSPKNQKKKKIESLKICLSKKIGLKLSFKDRDRCAVNLSLYVSCSSRSWSADLRARAHRNIRTDELSQVSWSTCFHPLLKVAGEISPPEAPLIPSVPRSERPWE